MMSDEVQGDHRTSRGVLGQLALWFVLPLLALAVLVLMMFFGGPSRQTTGTNDDKEKQGPQENYLAQVRSTLARQADLGTCRTVVQQLNSHLQKDKEIELGELPATQRERLPQLLALDKEELTELTSSRFTPLDVHHLEACFLFRDAAHSLELPSVSAAGKSVRQTPLEFAESGFAWVVRQVQLPPPGREQISDQPAPPAAVLRRGWGTPLERALAFLALLEQFGQDEAENATLQGCLVFCPDARGEKRLWACGVVIGNQATDLYLFDPRLGLPLPGPQGQGIATLAQAQRDSAILEQLKVEKLSYDVTPDQAKAATLAVICPLSAVSPRMHFLQDRLLRDRNYKNQALPSQVRVRLAEDPLKVLTAFEKISDKVEVWPQGVRILRSFLPRDEGGSDTGVAFEIRKLRGFTSPDDPRVARLPRERLFQMDAVPWEDFPPLFRDPVQFRFDIGLGQQLRSIFAGPFIRQLTEPGSPRDLLLRGRFPRAVQDLVPEQSQTQALRLRLLEARNLGPGLEEWLQNAIAAYASQLRAKGTPDEPLANAQVASLWKWKVGDSIEVLMSGAMAGPRNAWIMYQLALCRHEQATRLQARRDLAERAGAPLPAEVSNARITWIDAEGFWKEFLDGHPNRPGIASARRLRGEAQMKLGQIEEARTSWLNVSAPMTDLEKLACLWLAKQLKPASK